MPYFGVFIENGKAPDGGPAIHVTEEISDQQDQAVLYLDTRYFYPTADVYLVEASSRDEVISVFTGRDVWSLRHIKLLRLQTDN